MSPLEVTDYLWDQTKPLLRRESIAIGHRIVL